MKRKHLTTGLILLMLAGLSTFTVLAQDDAPVTEEQEISVTKEGETTTSLLEMIKQGGLTMWPLGLFSVATLFFIIRNSLLLREKTLLRPDLRPELENALGSKDVAGAREICDANICLMTSVLDAGLERITEGDSDLAYVEEAIEEAGNEQMVSFMKPINYLSIIGGTAPMLGLFGTVSGMIKAFGTIAAGGMGKPELLAGNIGEALITTATGLLIAIPAMIAYFIFKNSFIKQMSTMGRTVSHLLNIHRNAQKN